jgi:hypothetical protein
MIILFFQHVKINEKKCGNQMDWHSSCPFMCQKSTLIPTTKEVPHEEENTEPPFRKDSGGI